jgi:drug/metabolite transporter (DMT)-like permease
VALLARVVLQERIKPAATAGLLLGFAGIVVMVSRQLGGSHSGSDLAVGIGLSLAAGVAWAAGTMIVRRLAVRDPDLDFVGLTTAQYLAGSPILIVVALAVKGTGGTDWGSSDLWGATLWLALGSSAIATLAFFMSLKWLNAAQTSSAQFLVPVVAVVVEAVRGHAPGGLVLTGMGLAIAGVALVAAGDTALKALTRRQASPAA